MLTASLSVSSKSFFAAHWYGLVDSGIHKLKSKVGPEDKASIILCITRLIWVYLYRFPESLNSTVKKLQEVVDVLFFKYNTSSSSKKGYWLLTNANLMEALVQMIRVIGYSNLNFAMEQIILRILRQGFENGTLEDLQPEKLILAVKAYVGVLQATEQENRPNFPKIDIFDIASTCHVEPVNVVSTRRISAVKPNTALNIYDEICLTFKKLIMLLDDSFGCDLDGNVNTSSSGTGFKSLSTFSFHLSYDVPPQKQKDAQLELFAVLIKSLPYTLQSLPSEVVTPNEAISKPVVGLLTRNSVHKEAQIRQAAVDCLRRFSRRKNPTPLLNAFANMAFHFTEKTNFDYDSFHPYSPNFLILLKLYHILLEEWLAYIRECDLRMPFASAQLTEKVNGRLNKEALNELYQINHEVEDARDIMSNPDRIVEELEWKSISNQVENIEGNGLYFLCSQDQRVRMMGLKILQIVDKFDQEIHAITNKGKNDDKDDQKSKKHSRSSSKFAADVGTRVIHVLESVDFHAFIKPFKKELSVPERTRLTKFNHHIKNDKGQPVLLLLAESDYGIDSTIWLRLYPAILQLLFEKCPIPVALCRNIVCICLAQMHESILKISENYKANTSSFFQNKQNNPVPPELLIDQWKLYLIFACTTLTTTNEQKISYANQPTHGRKKSLQIFIQHQKITSAKSIFKMVNPLLRSHQLMIREAVITGLSHININILETFLDSIEFVTREWNTDIKKRNSSDDRFRIEVVHILLNAIDYMGLDDLVYTNENIVRCLITIIKNAKNFLSADEVQVNIDFQRLRRYFCDFLASVYLGLQDRPNLELWFPFEARISCFNYLKEWCGHGNTKALTDERYSVIIANIKQQKDAAAALALLEFERKKLELSALKCMTILCTGSLEQQLEIPGSLALVSFDIPGLLHWVHSLLESSVEKIRDLGKTALHNLLKRNRNNREIRKALIRESCVSQKSMPLYFCIFIESCALEMDKDKLEKNEHVQVHDEVVMLSCMLCVHRNSVVRRAALNFLQKINESLHCWSGINLYVVLLSSESVITRRRALTGLSEIIFNTKEESVFKSISILTKFYNVVDEYNRGILSIMLEVAMSKVCLKYEGELDENKRKEVEHNGNEDNGKEQHDDDDVNNHQNLSKLRKDGEGVKNSNETEIGIGTGTGVGTGTGTGVRQLCIFSKMVLQNLYEISIKFESSNANDLETMWLALVKREKNFELVFDFVLSSCPERQSILYVQKSCQIITYLAAAHPDSRYVVQKLIDNLQPKLMVPPRPSRITEPDFTSAIPYFANLASVLELDEKKAVFSLGQISLIFVVDLITTQTSTIVEDKLPLLLHTVVTLLDHYLIIVREQARRLLIKLVQFCTADEAQSNKATMLLKHEDRVKNLWVYDDLNNDKKGARTPSNMIILVRSILRSLCPSHPTLQDEWSKIALTWGTTCAVRHSACRSFQIFRVLISFLDLNVLKAMFHRLSNTISDESEDIQGFAMQILMTLNAIAAEVDSQKLIDFPQLFWSSVACLSTIHEQEFIEVLSIMNKFISKIDLNAEDTIACLISTFPPKWEGKFEGLQHIVSVGLRSSTSWEPTLSFMDKLLKIKDSQIIGIGDTRIVSVLVANLPRFLNALESNDLSEETRGAALDISVLAENAGKPAVSRILQSFAKLKFRSKEDFLVNIVSTMRDLFFAQHEVTILISLLKMLSNPSGYFRKQTLAILKVLIPQVNFRKDEFIGLGADLISPLLRLLLTDSADDALEVLDETDSISGSQLDSDILKMSLGGNMSMKKDYENAATLFGIPHESGWSVPMPAVTAASTRNNVHAVFSTCVAANVVENGVEAVEAEQNEEIQFHLEDYYYQQQPNTVADYAESISMSVDEPEVTLSNMWAALDDFDSFFNTETFANAVKQRAKLDSLKARSVSQNSTSNKNPIESVSNVYDKRVSPILNKGLASSSSQRTNYLDLIEEKGHTSTAQSRRSYIPFRNKSVAKSKETVTPSMSYSPVFEVNKANLQQTPSSISSSFSKMPLVSTNSTPSATAAATATSTSTINPSTISNTNNSIHNSINNNINVNKNNNINININNSNNITNNSSGDLDQAFEGLLGTRKRSKKAVNANVNSQGAQEHLPWQL